MKSFGFDFHNTIEKLQSSGKFLILTVIAVILLMIASCIIVFFGVVKDREQVMVPNVVGEQIENALIEMQSKELYPKVQLRYSNDPSDKGKILSQDPKQGAIVKAGRRINLTVSRGVVIDEIENYVGTTLDDVKVKLQTLFAGTSIPLIILADPLYEYNDTVPAGTIIEQDPPVGTSISEPVNVTFVISRGPEYERAKVPNLVGLSINDTLLQMTRSKLIFNFTSTTEGATTEQTSPVQNESDLRIARVISQSQTPGSEASIYSKVDVSFLMPDQPVAGTVYGILSTTLPLYPYALSVKLEALTKEGERYTIVAINHTGGLLTIPYAVPRNTNLILSVSDKEQLRQLVN